MTSGRRGMRGLVVGLSLLTEAGLAQAGSTALRGGTVGVAPASAIQPAGGGQVRQPPANSAMRRAGAGDAGRSVATGRMGMGLSGPGGIGAGGPAAMTDGAMRENGTRAPDAEVRITDSGITKRPSGESAGTGL